jgi:Mn-dependent DtxR family transcriptional regulator
MLAEILRAFREADRPIDLNRLSRQLDVESSALEGMLQTLVRQGKLREITPGFVTCTDCPHRFGCAYLQTGVTSGKVYELAETNR